MMFKTASALMLTSLMLTGCGPAGPRNAEKGIEALNKDKAAKALPKLEKAVKRYDAPAEVWNALGLARNQAGRRVSVEEAFAEARKKDPLSFVAAYNLGVFLKQEGRFQEATPHLQEAARIGPKRSEALRMLAGIAAEQNNEAAALGYLQQARERDPNNPELLNELALALMPVAPISQVRSLLQRAVALDPNLANAQLNLAALLDTHRLDPEQAISHYEAYMRLEPEDLRSMQVMSRISVLAQRVERGDVQRPDPVRLEVESLLEKATQASSDGNRQLALHLCLRASASARRANRNDLQERALRAAPALAPDSARAHYALGSFLYEQGQLAASLPPLQNAYNRAPSWPPALQALIEAQLATNELRAARELLKEAETRAASNPDLALEVALLTNQLPGESTRARRLLKEWLDANPAHARAAEVQALL